MPTNAHGTTSRGPATSGAKSRTTETLPSIAGERTSRKTGSKYAVMPGPAELKKLRDLGYTRGQIVDLVEQRTGHRVTPEAVSMALRRAKLTTSTRRYEDEIPWRVRQVHERAYPLAMLRLLGRRRTGIELTEAQAKRLDSWLEKLEGLTFPDGSVRPAVVDYDPDSEEGFRYVPRAETDDTVIRRPKG